MTPPIGTAEPAPRPMATDPLDSLRQTVAFSSLDWAASGDTAWIYGIVCGWACELDHRHDVDCGGEKAIQELMAQHGWSPTQVAHLRALRTRWLQLHVTAARQSVLEAKNIALLAMLAFSESGDHR